jgi:uncharacterized protein YqeY
MLTEEIRSRMFAAMKARNSVEKEILRVALGEISTAEARSGEPLDDAAVQEILRKLVKANTQTMQQMGEDERVGALKAENVVLESMLPQQLDEDAVVAALAELVDAIKAAPADGPAMGIAMKHLKSQGAAVDGRTVSAAIKRMRS